ncbi:MAG: magnesium/cobalt transporter CorA [Opitutaceae bacterium]|nr:magnesium/cobalt transporter CorA [Opitutaceae bacterium]
MIQSFVFSEGKLVGRDLEPEALRLVRSDKGLMVWIDLLSPTPEEWKLVLEEIFAFHPVAIEDCVAPDSLPKIEDYDDYLFLVTHGVDFSRRESFNTTELDIFLGKDYLVTFHKQELKSINSVAERCAKSQGVVAKGPDRLLHFILDQMVDLYKPVASEFSSKLEEIEEMILAEGTGGDLVPRLLALREEINNLRRIIRPQRDVVSRLTNGDSKLVRTIMLPYFRDLRDGLIRVDETAASFADQLLISFDLYLSKSDFQANEGIKALTALTALTLPATLIGTWYGMNFEHMPELRSAYGYPIAAAVTIALTGAMWFWCKRRRWI